MKNLDLNGLGVQEMNAEEMSVVDGGRSFETDLSIILLIVLIVVFL